MKIVVTGCFDGLHSGHVYFLEQAAKHGQLYVCVGSDATIRALKGPDHPKFPEAERLYMVQALGAVYSATIASGSGIMDAEEEIKIIKPDMWIVNEDGDYEEKRNFCNEHGIIYAVLQRTPALGLHPRSSTELNYACAFTC